jgi:hypothetical protein
VSVPEGVVTWTGPVVAPAGTIVVISVLENCAVPAGAVSIGAGGSVEVPIAGLDQRRGGVRAVGVVEAVKRCQCTA